MYGKRFRIWSLRIVYFAMGVIVLVSLLGVVPITPSNQRLYYKFEEAPQYIIFCPITSFDLFEIP